MSEENKNLSDEQFIERNMYEGKGSKNPKKPLILGILMAIVCIGGGFWIYSDILRWETEGGTIRMNRFSRLLYDIGGAPLILVFFVAVGIFIAYTGYQSYKNKKG